VAEAGSGATSRSWGTDGWLGLAASAEEALFEAESVEADRVRRPAYLAAHYDETAAASPAAEE